MRNPRLTKSRGRVLADKKPLRDYTSKLDALRKNILIVGPFGPVAEFFGHDKTTHILYFLEDDADRAEAIEEIKSGEKLAIFHQHLSIRVAWQQGGSIAMFWKEPFAKRYLAGAVQYHFEDWTKGKKTETVLVLTHMAVKPKWRGNRLNQIMLDFLKKENPGIKFYFHEPTEDGKAFMRTYGGKEYVAGYREWGGV